MSLELANAFIQSFAKTIYETPEEFSRNNLRVGVDLGTANICFAVLDGDNNNSPIAGEVFSASVVKDGLVVDYTGAVQIVRHLKEKIEKRIGTQIYSAAAAIPPGTMGKNAKAVSNVIESANIEVTNVIDEPSAAATVLRVTDGAVVDVGGGTTGISIIRGGEVIATHDEPTGGTHMTLVLSGNYGISFEEAEKLKLDVKKHKEIFHVIKPVVEKMATIVSRFLVDYPVDKIYVVGGASCFDGFEEVFTRDCGIITYKPDCALLVTPLGIALNHKG